MEQLFYFLSIGDQLTGDGYLVVKAILRKMLHALRYIQNELL